MDFLTWVQLAIVCALGAISPGPSLIIVIKNSKVGGFSSGVMTSVGHGLGVGVYALGAVLGLAFVSNNFPTFFLMADWLGASFLLYLGINVWISSFKKTGAQTFSLLDRNRNNFLEGFAIAFLNPKIAIFFLAIISQFIVPSLNWFDKIFIVMTASIIDTFWYVIVATILTGDWIVSRLEHHSNILDRLMACILFLIALGLLFKVP